MLADKVEDVVFRDVDGLSGVQLGDMFGLVFSRPLISSPFHDITSTHVLCYSSRWKA